MIQTKRPWQTADGYKSGVVLTLYNWSRRTRSAEPLEGVTHGTARAYRIGCGCEACRGCVRDYMRRKRAERDATGEDHAD